MSEIEESLKAFYAVEMQHRATRPLGTIRAERVRVLAG